MLSAVFVYHSMKSVKKITTHTKDYRALWNHEGCNPLLSHNEHKAGAQEKNVLASCDVYICASLWYTWSS